MAVSTLTSKGQVTIPKEIRTRLGLRPGDRLDFQLDEAGQLKVSPASEASYLRLFGSLKHRAREKPVTMEEMRQAVLERAGEKLGRRSPNRATEPLVTAEKISPVTR